MNDARCDVCDATCGLIARIHHLVVGRVICSSKRGGSAADTVAHSGKPVASPTRRLASSPESLLAAAREVVSSSAQVHSPTTRAISFPHTPNYPLDSSIYSLDNPISRSLNPM
jgi:hypothetical protein